MTRAALFDGNVLIALADAAHVHHAYAVAWFTSSDVPFATCPVTQGALLRMLMRSQAVPTVEAANHVLQQFVAHPRHRFWPDTLSYADIAWKAVLGHRQVTDAYLAALARHRHGSLLTFDQGLAATHADVVELVPSGRR